MTALAANLRQTIRWTYPFNPSSGGSFKHVAATESFYQGAIISLNLKTGVVQPLGSIGEGEIPIGLCTVRLDVTSGDGKEIGVDIGGPIAENISVTGVTAQTDVGRLVYAVDDNIDACTLTRASTDYYPIGRVVRWRSSTYCDIKFFDMTDSIEFLLRGGGRYQVISKRISTFTAGYDVGSASTGVKLHGIGKLVEIEAWVETVPTSDAKTVTITPKINDTAGTGSVVFLGSANQTRGVACATITQPTPTSADEFYPGDLLQIACATAGTVPSDGALYVRIVAEAGNL